MRSRLEAGVVVRRLRAVGAVLGAAAGLHRQQRAELHLVGRVVLAVDELRAQDQLRQRQVVDRANLGERVVVAGSRRRSFIIGSPFGRACPRGQAGSIDPAEDDENPHRQPARGARGPWPRQRRLLALPRLGRRRRRARIPEAVGVLAPAHVGLGGAHARVLLAEPDRGHAVERVEHVGVEARLADLLPVGWRPCGRDSDRAAGTASPAARRRGAPRARSGASPRRRTPAAPCPVTRWLDGRAAESVRTPRQAQPPSACRLREQEAEPALDARIVVVARAAEHRQRPAVKVQRDRRAARFGRLAERQIADAAVGVLRRRATDRRRAPPAGSALAAGRTRPCVRARAGSRPRGRTSAGPASSPAAWPGRRRSSPACAGTP